jgi:hypothetical protein
MYQDFSFVNFFLFLLTFSSVLIFFYDLRPIATFSTLKSTSKITLAVLTFEAIYGISQGLVSALRRGTFDGASGDNVRGTIEPSFTALGLGGNVMFAILISSLFLYVLSNYSSRKSFLNYFLYIIVLLSWVLASVLHTLIFFGIAFLIAVIIFKTPSIKTVYNRYFWKFRRQVLLSIIVLIILSPILIPRNLGTLPSFIRYTIDIRENAYSEKARAIYSTIFKLPQDYPLQPIFGIGPGHYSSRASLIRSGEYLKGTSIPLPPFLTQATEKYIIPLWESFQKRPGGGSTYFPFFTWMSLYGELGLLGILAVILTSLKLVYDIRKMSSTRLPGLSFGLLTLIIYFILLGFQDNYWEFTQVVFPAFLVIKLGFSFLQNENRNISHSNI